MTLSSASPPPCKPGTGWLTDPLLGIALAIALALRLPAMWGRAMWLDEAQFAAVVSLPTTRDMVSFLADHESHPPLYYLIARGWSALFGRTDAAFTSLSLVVGLLVIVAVYAITEANWSRWAARLAALLAATSTPMVFAASAARPYALLGGLALLSTWLAWRLTASASLAAAAAFGLAGAVMVYTHHWAWMILAAQGLVGLAFCIRRRHRQGTLVWLSAGGLVLVLYVPWMPTLLTQVAQAGHHRPDVPLEELLYQCTLMATGLAPLAAAMCAAAIVALVVAKPGSSTKAATSHGSPGAAAYWVAVPAVVVILALAATPLANLLVRQAFTTLAPLLGVAASAVIDRERTRWRWAGGGVAAVFVLASAAHSTSYARTERSTVRWVAEEMASEEHGNGTLAIVPIYVAPPFVRYYRGEGEVRAFPDEARLSPAELDNRLQRDTARAGINSLLERIEMAAVQGQSVWLIVGGMPSHLYAVSDQVEKALQSRYGSPAVVGVGDGRWAFFERVTATLYVARRSGAGSAPHSRP